MVGRASVLDLLAGNGVSYYIDLVYETSDYEIVLFIGDEPRTDGITALRLLLQAMEGNDNATDTVR